MKPKHQRLTLLLLALGAMLAAILLAMSALRDQAAYFYSPADLARAAPPVGKAVRVGGMVRAGSIRRQADGLTIDFTVEDGSSATIQVRFRGIAPELFKEGSGVVAEGRFQAGGLFVADEILAKHDENYMPPKAAGERHRSDTLG